MVMQYLQGLPDFLFYFVSCYVLVLIYCCIYTLLTPHKEWRLLKDPQQGAAASIAFGGSLLGVSLPIASAAIHSVSIVDFWVWGVVAIVAQIITFFAVRIYMPRVSQRIHDNEIPAGVFLGVASLATGVLNAACMSY